MASGERILYCRCKYARVVPTDTKEGVLDRLAETGKPFHAVPDLCEMAARRDPTLKQYSEDSPLTILACYPRAVTSLFNAAGASLQNSGVKVLNMRVESVDAIMAQLNGDGDSSQSEENQ